jgi:hypothetical protein
MISKSINEIKKTNNKSKYFTLIGDKAYKTNNKFKLNDKNIKIVTPNKKNTINKNSNFNNKKLKSRIKVENSINQIKKYERIKTRKDKKIINFMSWVYISCLLNNIKC